MRDGDGARSFSVVWGREPQRALTAGVSIEDGRLRRLIIPTRSERYVERVERRNWSEPTEDVGRESEQSARIHEEKCRGRRSHAGAVGLEVVDRRGV